MDNYNTEIYKRMIVENKLNNKNNNIPVIKIETGNDIKLGNDMGYYVMDTTYAIDTNIINQDYHVFSPYFLFDENKILYCFSATENDNEINCPLLVKTKNLDEYFSDPHLYLQLCLYHRPESGGDERLLETQYYYNRFKSCFFIKNGNEYMETHYDELLNTNFTVSIDGVEHNITIKKIVID